ncbi:hypothetical protein [Alienimonas californiensis]|uniref:Uncharacterized protein n=1 Tax=Alienimonas californiensis TaxID=2527989 RepID=A0A517PA14_9PLAN|nr:hypothetical protein [Alienimonas californiensis]QDT16208.1 hypothetical protein CA12_23080 [Alienimonas californiensis]
MLRAHGKLLAIAGLAVTFMAAETSFAGLTGADRLKPGVGFHARGNASAYNTTQRYRQSAPRSYAAPQYYAAPRGMTVPAQNFGSVAVRPAAPAPTIATQPRVVTQPRIVHAPQGRVIYQAPAYHVPAAPAPRAAGLPVAPPR